MFGPRNSAYAVNLTYETYRHIYIYIYIYHAKSRLNTPVWGSINNSEEFETFIVYLADKYISLYHKYSKGKEKYANLYLAWLDVIS